MPTMPEHMAALAQITGWTALTAPAPEAVWRVELENDLDAVFFSPDNTLGIMRGVVVELSADNDALLREAAQKQMTTVRDRQSLLALEEPGQSLVHGDNATSTRLICFRTVLLNVDTDTFLAEVQDWLNDFAWWKTTLSTMAEQGNKMTTIFTSDLFSGLKL